MPTCARCQRPLHVGDHVTLVRVITRITDGVISTDRVDNAVAHLTCPEN